MRVYTLIASILVHAMAVVAIAIAPLFAAMELPEPRRSSVLVVPRPVTVAEPDVPKASTRAVEPQSEVTAPVAAPPSVAPRAFPTQSRTCRLGTTRHRCHSCGRAASSQAVIPRRLHCRAMSRRVVSAAQFDRRSRRFTSHRCIRRSRARPRFGGP